MSQFPSFIADSWALPSDQLALLATMEQRGHFAGRPQSRRKTEDAVRVDRQRTIAVLPIHSLITHRPVYSWVTSWQGLSAALAQLVADNSVSHIVLELDSSGGQLAGLQEFADQVYQARSRKPVLAIANSVASTGAYWVGSQASKFYCTPGGQVGEIGFYMAHQDRSKAYEKAGIKPTLISAGKYKTEGNDTEPLGAEARKFLQSQVDEYHRQFVAAVARGRGVTTEKVRKDFGQGRTLLARPALQAGMVDAVMSFNTLMNELGARRSGNASRLARSLAMAALH